MATLKEIVINQTNEEVLTNDTVSSNDLIIILTKNLHNGGWTKKEIYEAQRYIKGVIKSEVVESLDKQIETFKHFLKLK